MKTGIKYTLTTGITEEEILDSSVTKNNEDVKNKTGIWKVDYGINDVGIMDINGKDIFVFGGQILANTKAEARGLLSGLKEQIKISFPEVKKVSERLVAEFDKI